MVNTTTVNQPLVDVTIQGANTVVANATQKVLFVGQKTSSGTATAGALTENVLDNTEDGLFGADSMLAAMVKAARSVNKINWFDVIALDDNGSGVDATGSIAASGTATEAGTYTVTVGSEANNTYTVSVANGDTATVIGDAIEAAITADTTCPANAANTTGTVALTAVNAGTYGNSIPVSVSGAVAGVTITVTGMSGGSTDPVLTGVFDVVGDNRYQGVVWAYPDATTELTTFLDARFNVSGKVLDGVGFTAKSDTLSNHISALGGLNSQSLVFFCGKQISETLYKGPDIVEMPIVTASQFVGIRALRLTDGANVSQFVISRSGGLDNFGGAALASKPYFNTLMPDTNIIKTGRGWSDTEIEQLGDQNGGSIIGNNIAGNSVIAGEIYTTYKTDQAGNPDDSYKYLNYVDTISSIREYYFNNLRAQYAQSRLTEGDVIRGRDQANPAVIKAFCERLYQDLSGEDFVLVQAGSDAVKFFKDNLVVTVDLQTGTASIQMVAPIVTQLRNILATIQLAFSTTN